MNLLQRFNGGSDLQNELLTISLRNPFNKDVEQLLELTTFLIQECNDLRGRVEELEGELEDK